MDINTTGIRNGIFASKVDTTYTALNSIQILPKLIVNYKLNNTNLYALISRGYKTGGFNLLSNAPKTFTFDPEHSWNYEVGVKSSVFENRLFVEGSLFYIDWKTNKSIRPHQAVQVRCSKNAGHSVSKGLELSLNTASIQGFELMASYGYTDATFISNVLSSTADYRKLHSYVPKIQLQLN